MSSNQYDILIVGAGMVGTSLALALSSLPLRIALTEAFPIKTEAQFDADGRSLALTYGSARILQTLNVWKNLEQFATPIHTVHISDRGHFGMTRIKASEEKVPALGYVVPAPILGVELNKALLSLSQITLFNPATVQNIIGNTVELMTPEGVQTITAKLIVAADGTNSTIRKLKNIATEEKDYQQSAIATAITLTGTHNNIAYERFTEQGALAFLPLPGSCGGLVWTAPNDIIQQLQALSDEEFLQRVQSYFGYRLGKFLQVGKRHVYPLKMLLAKEQMCEGLVLIGNAAHTLHPIAAQGFNLGLMDVNLLAQVITEAAHAGKDISELSVLQKYEVLCKQSQQKIMKFTDSLTHLFAHDFLPLTLARNASLLTLDILSPLKRRLAKRLMGITQ